MTKRFPFPNPVNETSARIVAAGVVAISTLFLLTNSTLVLIALTYGFVDRVWKREALCHATQHTLIPD